MYSCNLGTCRLLNQLHFKSTIGAPQTWRDFTIWINFSISLYIRLSWLMTSVVKAGKLWVMFCWSHLCKVCDGSEVLPSALQIVSSECLESALITVKLGKVPQQACRTDGGRWDHIPKNSIVVNWKTLNVSKKVQNTCWSMESPWWRVSEEYTTWRRARNNWRCWSLTVISI